VNPRALGEGAMPPMAITLIDGYGRHFLCEVTLVIFNAKCVIGTFIETTKAT